MEERNRISPFISSEMLRLQTIADRQRTEYERKFPHEPGYPMFQLKPAWSKEGEHFSGVSESFSTFSIGRVTRIRGRMAVFAHLEWINAEGVSYPWTDVLILDRAGNDWVVADVLFREETSLLGELREGIARTEKHLGQLRNKAKEANRR